MNYKKVVIVLMALMYVKIMVFSMEQQENKIKIKIGDANYSLTAEQASQSTVLQEFLKEQSDFQEAISLPLTITQDVFDYIYKDLVEEPYDAKELSDEMLGKLFNAAHELDIDILLDKYTQLTIDRIEQEKESIILEVEKKPLKLTRQEANKLKTIAHMIEDIEEVTEPIPLPKNIKLEAFEYIYEDLKGVQYFEKDIPDSTLIDLINTANYLDIENLLIKYRTLLINRLKTISNEKRVQQVIKLMHEKLPIEMQETISQAIREAARLIFKNLSQASIDRVPKRERNLVNMVMSPDKKTMALWTPNKITLRDVKTNEKLWVNYGISENVKFIMFSSDSSKLLKLTNNALFVFDVDEGKIIWRKFIDKGKVIAINGFFSDVNRIVVTTIVDLQERIIVFDFTTGESVYKIASPRGLIVKNCYYNPTLKTLGIEFSSLVRTDILIVDINTGKEIKNKKSSELERYYISPDGKHIISVSKELVSVENSANDENNFTWAFKKQLQSIPESVSFSPDNSLFALKNVSLHEPLVFVFNMNTGQSVWAGTIQVLVGRHLFSPDATALAISGDNEIFLIDLLTKKELWHQKFNHFVANIYFVSNNILALGLKPDSGEKIKFVFCDRKTGNILIKKSYNKEMKKRLFRFIAAVDNFLYGYITNPPPSSFAEEGIRNYYELVCFDISSLSIFDYLESKDLSLDQALLIYFIFKSMKNNKRINVDAFDQIYEQLPEDIKSMVKKYNDQHVEIGATIRGTAPLKKTPTSAVFKHYGRD